MRKNIYFLGLLIFVLAIGLMACGGGQEAGTSQSEQAAETVAPADTSAPAEQTTQVAPAAAATKELPDAVKSIYTGTPASYTLLGDFEKSEAQINYYSGYPLDGVSPTNFVIRTDATWATASETSNWEQTGCGFLFRFKDKDNHYASYLGLDGNVTVITDYQGQYVQMKKGYVGNVAKPEGNAELMLFVNGDKINFFVDGQSAYSGTDTLMTGSLAKGGIGFLLYSGTNKDYGTRCQWKNTDLWDLGE